MSFLPATVSTGYLFDLLSSPPTGVKPPPFSDHLTPQPTDVKVLLTKQGRSRRMAFIGYKSTAEAQWALDAWQGVWVEGLDGKGGGSQVKLGWAQTAKSPETRDRPAKRQRLSVENKSGSGQSKSSRRVAEEIDPKLADFMDIMQPNKGKSLVDDILTAESDAAVAPANSASEETRLKTEAQKATRAAEETEPSKQVGAGRVEELGSKSEPRNEVVDDAGISDMEYLRKRMKKTVGDRERFTLGDAMKAADTAENREGWEQSSSSSSDVNDGADRSGGAASPPNTPPSKDADVVSIMETGRLFVRNLPFSASSEELETVFSAYGSVSQVHLPVDTSKRPKGFAYVLFSNPRDAVSAYRALDQTDFQGRLLHIIPAVNRDGKSDLADGKVSGVKAERAAKKKADADKAFHWSSLYMGTDAVATSVATRLNIPKSELFDPSPGNAAVKLALAETSLISSTKSYLEDLGVNIAAFSPSSATGARSPSTILVKNFPFGTSETAIKSMFQDFGEVRRILFPPAGTLAVVDMANAEEARAAFTGLAYKRIGSSVLYLEKAPAAMWDTGAIVGDSALAPRSVTETSEVKHQDLEGRREPGSTLFVRNLAWSTTTEALATTFRELPGFVFARVQTKLDPKRPPHGRLSMGFGFVGFKTTKAAVVALKAMSGYSLDGHALEVKFAQRSKDAEDTEAGLGKAKHANNPVGEASSAKLLIKNVPFEASKKDVRELFGSYGTLKSVRLPKQFDRRNRGFAFVEYISREEAGRAAAALRHTHLLGRHLVCTYADDAANQDLEVLRLKSGGRLLREGRPATKRKFQGLDESKGVSEQAGDEWRFS